MNKVKVEIYEGDPFSGCCRPVRVSPQAARNVDRMLERNEIVKRINEEFKEKIEITREIVSQRRPLSSYPAHVRELLAPGVKMPFIFVDEQLAIENAFPSFEEFKLILDNRLEALCGADVQSEGV